jgi:hypothetical protein
VVDRKYKAFVGIVRGLARGCFPDVFHKLFTVKKAGDGGCRMPRAAVDRAFFK